MPARARRLIAMAMLTLAEAATAGGPTPPSEGGQFVMAWAERDDSGWTLRRATWASICGARDDARLEQVAGLIVEHVQPH